jgi:hypothetical protein
MTPKHFITFLKTLRNDRNADLLESIEKGFRHVYMEGDTLGNIYAHQIGRHSTPKASTVGGVMAAPADMITEDSRMSAKKKVKPKKPAKKPEEEMHECAVDNQGLCHTCGRVMDEDTWYIYNHGIEAWRNKK